MSDFLFRLLTLGAVWVTGLGILLTTIYTLYLVELADRPTFPSVSWSLGLPPAAGFTLGDVALMSFPSTVFVPTNCYDPGADSERSGVEMRDDSHG